MIEIRAVGGYGEIGRNMTAIKIADEVFILDMGLMMDKYIEIAEDDAIINISGRRLINTGAAPNIDLLGSWKNKVKAIIVGHAHLDHLGAVPFLANKFTCPIYGSQYTIAVLRSILKDDSVILHNDLHGYPANSTFHLTTSVQAEIINTTHSIPQTVMIALHTPEGTILYGLDSKIDETPTLGNANNFERLQTLKPKVFIMDTLYATTPGRMPSERVAAEQLKTIIKKSKARILIITTFASHVARLKTIAEVVHEKKRIPVFLGRSITKYLEAAESCRIANFLDSIIIKYSSASKKWLRKVREYNKYVFIVTGNQGEPKSMLSRIVHDNVLPLDERDEVIFSCTVIPVDVSKHNRAILEKALHEKKVLVQKDVHASGHGSLGDMEVFLQKIQPMHVIPAHSNFDGINAFITMSKKHGYVDGKTVHRLKTGETLTVQ